MNGGRESKADARKGRMVLMGSGELTATMVEVHKALLSRYGPKPRAAFLDTPAGFQLNADQISEKAAGFFRRHVGVSLQVVSFKSREALSPFDAEQAFIRLKESDFILFGPGSPTYTVAQLDQTPIPEIFRQRIAEGATLVAASAAALTVGRFTLPVYEIYKVGQPLHWADGLDLLSGFGLDLVVIPHWNNAEGGTHDTRFCFMGKKRLLQLEALLPGDAAILGIDEHTACILDFERRNAEIFGIGGLTLRSSGKERTFESGQIIPLDALKPSGASFAPPDVEPSAPGAPAPDSTPSGLWNQVRSLEARFQVGLESRNGRESAGALLELDRLIWEAHASLEGEEVISQAREILREWIALLGNRFSEDLPGKNPSLKALVEELLALRQRFRDRKQWREADALREALSRADVLVEDTPNGSRWRLEIPGSLPPETGPK